MTQSIKREQERVAESWRPAPCHTRCGGELSESAPNAFPPAPMASQLPQVCGELSPSLQVRPVEGIGRRTWSNPPISQMTEQRLGETAGTASGPAQFPLGPGLVPCPHVRRSCSSSVEGVARGSLVLTSWMDIVFVSRNTHARRNTRSQSPRTHEG